MSGTYNPVTYQLSTSTMPCTLQKNLQSHTVRKPLLENTNGTVYTSTYSSDLSSLAESESEQKYPDLLDISTSPNKINSVNPSTKACSEGGSLNDISEIFCTLPRKRGIHNSRYISTDSQFPLLQESRYNSSGGESISDGMESCRRLSDSQKYTPYNLNRNKLNQRSNSYLNLTTTKRESSVPPSPIRELETSNATPLLDFTSLQNRSYNPRQISPVTATTSNANTYDYHAAQLERFLEEYRTLQKQLTKMKETCDNLRHDKNKYYDPLQNNPTTPIDDSKNARRCPGMLTTTSPNSNQTLESSLCFPNYDNELNRYLTPTNNKYN